MYATEYRWISEPTNVTSRTKVSDSGSTSSPADRSNRPAEIQSNRCTRIDRSSAGRPSSSTSSSAPTTNAAVDASRPSQWPQRSERRPSSSSTAALASGTATSSGAREFTSTVPSALQQVDVVDGGRLPGAEDRHDDRQPDDHLRGGHDHDEEGHDLAGQVAVQPGERHQRQVGRVEHELDAHEHDDRVPAQQHRRGADREQDPGEHQVVREGHRSVSVRVEPPPRSMSAVGPVVVPGGAAAGRGSSSTVPRAASTSASGGAVPRSASTAVTARR